VVPEGVTEINTVVVAAGGGGGGNDGGGDNRAGGASGSGEIVTDTTLAVTPGTTLTLVVGKPGKRGIVTFNGVPMFPIANTSTTKHGLDGGNSYIAIDDTILIEAIGGNGGIGNSGDNGSGRPGQASGASGSMPGSVPYPQRNSYPQSDGGWITTVGIDSYGAGGNSNGNTDPPWINSTDGQGGYIWVGMNTDTPTYSEPASRPYYITFRYPYPSYTVAAAGDTYITFNTDGSVTSTTGAKSSWLTDAPVASAGDNYWIIFKAETPSAVHGDTTLDTWLQLNAARTFKVQSGQSTAMQFEIASESTGRNKALISAPYAHNPIVVDGN
jgi:hypothetical protein